MINISVDLDGTAEKFPELYKELLKNISGKVYFLTARPATEILITLDHIEEWGLQESYDELIMCPIPHIFDIGTRSFWSDTGEIVFASMKHRQAHFDWLKEKELTKQLDTPVFTKQIADWKVQECLKRDVKAMFEDNLMNVEKLKEAGIYTFTVDREFAIG